MEIRGRDREVAVARERLGSRRLVTITGPGGIGKTALSRVVASQVASEFAGGVVAVDLTRVDDPAGVNEMVAGQLGFADFESLLDAPLDRSLLVLLDNCEHVLDAAAHVTSRLLAASGRLTFLTTSRSPLDLPGESIVTLGPLAVPVGDDDEAPALQLLIDRAGDQGVELASTDRSLLAEVARNLDGVPLAIELAAARLRSVSPAELLRELDERPHTLSRRRYRGQANHRSVADMVQWSCDLLAGRDLEVFHRLGVFAGPFTAELAQAVAADVAEPAEIRDALDELVAGSLLVVDRSGPVARHRLLHPVRAVALDRLERAGAATAARQRLADHVLSLAVGIIERASEGWGTELLGELAALYHDIAASIRWALANDDRPDRALTLVALLWGLVHQAHTAEIGRLGEATLQRWPDPAAPLWADAAATVATCRALVRDHEGAIALAEASLRSTETSLYAPITLRRVLAQTHRILGDLDRSLELFREGADLAAAAGLPGFSLELRVAEAIVLAQQGEVDEGLRLLDEVLAASEGVASLNHAWAGTGRGAVLLGRDAAEALPVLEAALAESRAIGYPAGETHTLRPLALARLELGDVAGAAAALLELVDTLLGRGGLNDLRLALDVAALVLERVGDERWADLAVTATGLPITTLLVDRDPAVAHRAASSGRMLAVGEACRTCRAALAEVEAGGADAVSPAERDADRSPEVAAGPAMVLEGEVWRLSYGATTIRLKRSKGLDDLAVLLAAPGRDVASLDLMGSAVASGSAEDELLDSRARRAYEERVRDLQQELDEAEAGHDIARAERIRLELDAIVDSLTAALGMGGRQRRTTGAAERARSAVTQRLRATIRRIERHHPPLGAHLRAAVSTGVLCRYGPNDPAPRWTVSRNA